MKRPSQSRVAEPLDPHLPGALPRIGASRMAQRHAGSITRFGSYPEVAQSTGNVLTCYQQISFGQRRQRR